MQDHNEWLKFAFEDLKAAKKLISGEDPLIGSATFHTQQCAEKSLKGFLAYSGAPLRRIHDLTALVSFCKKIDAEFLDIESEAASLNPYLCQTRYPEDSFLMVDLTTAYISIDQAEKIYDLVMSKIIF